MRKLDRFIMKSFIGPFVAILAVVVFILIMQFLWLYIDDLVGKGLGMRVVLEFLMWGGCTVLPLSLPLATLLSSMMIIGQLGENNELIALKASGISFFRVISPLIILSVFISLGAFFVGDLLVPHAWNEILTLRDDIGRTKNEIKIPSGTFYDGIDGYILRVDEQDKESGTLYGVMVYDHTENKGNTTLTIADSAQIKLSKSKDYLTFTLYNGINYIEDNKTSYKDTSLALQHIDFKKQDLLIRLDHYSFEKSDSSRFGNQARTMRSKDLKIESANYHRFIDSMHVVNFNTARKFSALKYGTQLDTASRNPNRELFGIDSLKFKNLDEQQRVYSMAANAARGYYSDITNLKYNSYQERFYVRYTDVEWYKKFAQALACFILFFIGAPLGALVRKGGLGASAIISVLFFVLYWVVDISGTKLATDGAVAAGSGAFVSAFVLAPIGAFLTWKAINESDLFNMDQLKMLWRSLKSRVVRFFRPVRIVYMGTPEFAVAPLDALRRSGYNVVGVVTVADKPSGRGLKVNESAVKRYAVENNIPVLQPLKLRDPEFLKALAAWKADLFVVVAFRMLPEEVWAMPRLGTFNLHAALLPQYRGAAPINWAIINGEKRTGVTTFMLDKNIDTGAILLRQDCLIEPEDNAGTLHDKLMVIGSDLVVQSVEGVISHNIETRVQRSFIQGSEVLKPAPKLTKELCHIDWNQPSTTILNLIRGLSPYPTAYTELLDNEGNSLSLKIFSGHIVSQNIIEDSSIGANLVAAGTVISDGKTFFAIATADGAIAIDDLQISGKKRMTTKAFLAGFRNPTEYHC